LQGKSSPSGRLMRCRHNIPTETTAATAAAAAGKTAQTTAPAKKDFLNMTLNEKVEYINSLPADQRNDFVQNMSNEERNSFLKQMKTSDQLVLGCGAGTLTASATSVGDVIAHAYAVGLPESDIQACIAQYSGREYTSEQCDQAIAALDNWAKERDDKINEEINKGTTTASFFAVCFQYSIFFAELQGDSWIWYGNQFS
jgi:hypothetical protein